MLLGVGHILMLLAMYYNGYLFLLFGDWCLVGEFLVWNGYLRA